MGIDWFNSAEVSGVTCPGHMAGQRIAQPAAGVGMDAPIPTGGTGGM